MNRNNYAYGAAAKGNSLLNFAVKVNDFFNALADLAPSKHGKFLQGSHHTYNFSRRTKIRKSQFDSYFTLQYNI